jgi:PAS domain S-box-containing protein
MLFAQTPLAVIEWSPALEILNWNPAAEQIFGYSRDEVLGRHGASLLSPAHDRQMAFHIASAMKAGAAGSHATLENMHRDGRHLICEWNNTTLVDDSARCWGGIHRTGCDRATARSPASAAMVEQQLGAFCTARATG